MKAASTCATPTSCQRHDKVGHFLKVGLGGVLSAPLKWDGAILGGIAVTQAFPFVGKKLVIDPVRRLTHSALAERERRGPRDNGPGPRDQGHWAQHSPAAASVLDRRRPARRAKARRCLRPHGGSEPNVLL